MTVRRPMRIAAALVMMTWTAVTLTAGQNDVVTRARTLAIAGQRGEAITLLEDSVALSPGNSDARVLLGTVLSWEGRYDEARTELETVLSGSPTHGDALPAMINVELWSDHFTRAEELASRALRNRPNDTGMLLARARALRALQRPSDARDTLDRLLVIDPRNEPAREMRRSVQGDLRLWQMHVSGSYDAFSDQRVAWREWQASVSRTTPIGSVIVKGSRAERFGDQDQQVEVEAYPRIRPGTYAYVAAAYAPEAVLYPSYRYAADIYQSLGAGFEGSAGYRRLSFGSGVSIYTAALSKYYGQWLFTGRTYITPNSAGTSRSYHGSFRRYFKDGGTYAGLRYGRGGWREELRNRSDLEILDSDVYAAEVNIVLRGRLELRVSGSYSHEDRVEHLDVRQYSLSTGMGFRF